MTTGVLLALALLAPVNRPFHHVTVAQLATTRHTHVSVCAIVARVTQEADGDLHVVLQDGKAFVVGEIIPDLPLPAPPRGARIRVEGISRVDRAHRWNEIHPMLRWVRVTTC